MVFLGLVFDACVSYIEIKTLTIWDHQQKLTPNLVYLPKEQKECSVGKGVKDFRNNHSNVPRHCKSGITLPSQRLTGAYALALLRL
jgi:hypothetical protein